MTDGGLIILGVAVAYGVHTALFWRRISDAREKDAPGPTAMRRKKVRRPRLFPRVRSLKGSL